MRAAGKHEKHYVETERLFINKISQNSIGFVDDDESAMANMINHNVDFPMHDSVIVNKLARKPPQATTSS